MFGMFWIALELGNPKMGLNKILSLLIKKLSAFKIDEVAKSDNTPEGEVTHGGLPTDFK